MVFFAYKIIRKMTRILVKKVLTSILVICIISIDKESCHNENYSCQMWDYMVQKQNREEMIICHLKII